MTLDKLLGASAEELEKYTDAQLLEYFKDVLHVTRPSLEQQKQNNEQRPKKSVSPGSQKAKALELAAKLGLDLGIK